MCSTDVPSLATFCKLQQGEEKLSIIVMAPLQGRAHGESSKVPGLRRANGRGSQFSLDENPFLVIRAVLGGAATPPLSG